MDAQCKRFLDNRNTGATRIKASGTRVSSAARTIGNATPLPCPERAGIGASERAMTRARWKVKGRRDAKARFALIPADVIHSANWAHASKPCRALVTDIAVQYGGHNNGDLTASITVLRPLGWTSPGTIKALLQEAAYYGLLVQTRQGGLLIGASLYALGWKPVNACIDPRTRVCKLDDPSMVGVTPGSWRVPQPKYQRPPRKKTATTPRVQGRYAARTSKAPHRYAARSDTGTF